jgi:small subunit ribosomal protein S16
MLKIRLMRIGAKKRPFYRVVAVDERAKRTGGYLELLGTYNPLTQPHEIKLKQDRIDHWVKQGAQLSDGFLRIIGKAPQRPPRKPKKAASAESSSEPKEKAEAAAPASEEAPVAEEPAVEAAPEEAPVEAEAPVVAEETAAAEEPTETETPAESADEEKVEG